MTFVMSIALQIFLPSTNLLNSILPIGDWINSDLNSFRSVRQEIRAMILNSPDWLDLFPASILQNTPIRPELGLIFRLKNSE